MRSANPGRRTLVGLFLVAALGTCRAAPSAPAAASPAPVHALLPSPSPAASMAKAATTEPARAHAGRAGIYLRLGAGDRAGDEARGRRRAGQDASTASNPLVDAVVFPVRWSEVEPAPGRFDFSAVVAETEAWGRAGKGVVLSLPLYGQETGDKLTPDWVYREGAEAIAFRGGGEARGAEVRVPRVWDERFVERRIEPLVRAFARALDGHPNLWYVMPGYGHIGNLSAQPSADGGPAFTRAGWTPAAWRRYCLAVTELYRASFKRTPLLVKSAPILLRDPERQDHRPAADALVTELSQLGVAVLRLGIGSDPAEMQGIHRALTSLAPLAVRGETRIGLGDDWPLWVPEKRRGRGPTRGYDTANLEKILDLALGPAGANSATPVTILFCQEPELRAAHPGRPGFEPRVADLLGAARERLRANDAAIFSKRVAPSASVPGAER